jgi:hypothetical protein
MKYALALLSVLVLGACSGTGVVKVKDPGPVPETTTTTVIDYAHIGLKTVSGRGGTTVPMGPGNAGLTGTVTGPDGLVEGATVHVERIVASGSATVDVTTAADGTWSVAAILGGRYRVRAWKAPELALTKPELFYIQSSEQKTVGLRVDRYSGGIVTSSIAPNPPPIGAPSNLFVLVSQRTVDNGGIVRSAPVVGVSVDLTGSGVQLETANPTVTDGNGVAEWRVRCRTQSQPSLTVVVGSGSSFPLTVPACIDESGGVASTTSSSSVSRTSTTSRRG